MNKKVYKHAMKKGIYSLSAGIVMVVLVCLLFGSLFVSAHEDTADTDTIYKYYRSIEIQPGDTLWDIAESIRQILIFPKDMDKNADISYNIQESGNKAISQTTSQVH